MPTQIQLPPLPVVTPEARSASQPAPLPMAAKPVCPKAYWADRLTVVFWILCFGLMLAMNFFEALHRFVLFLLARGPAS